MLRTNVYVDGFNFYYGAVKGTPYKWLDFRALAQLLLPRGYTINDVHYFTARLNDTPSDPTIAFRQSIYLQALAHHGRVDATYGTFRSHPVSLPLTQDRNQRVTVIRTEEKGSDVNLAVQLLRDAYERRVDSALVMSNDSDLQGALDLAVELGVEVIVVNPHRRTDTRGQLQGSDTRNLRKSHLERSQLPTVVTTSAGGQLHKPTTW